MTRTPEQVSRNIIDKLRITDPALSLEVGTIERKIVDAVSEAISESYLDRAIIDTSWSVDTKTGIELEQFVGIFGFGRLQGRRATGKVKFSLDRPATTVVMIPFGVETQTPTTETTTAVGFNTLAAGTIDIGQSYVEVIAQCVAPGAIGNIASSKITSFSNALLVSSVTNVSPFTGGVDVETDEELRQRFKDTLLRNLAGTEDYYEAMCLQFDGVTRVKVLGPVSTHREQLQITSGTATSQNTFSKYTWPAGEFVSTDPGTASEVYYTPATHYTMSTAIPPVLTVVDSVALPNTTIVDVEHEYVSQASRNNPASGITNKVDVFVDGQELVTVTEESPISSTNFNTTSGDTYKTTNFIRVAGTGINTNPTSGRKFQRLGSQPLVNFPTSIIYSGSTYTLGTHYNIVASTLVEKGTQREVAGLEWISNPSGSGNATFVYDYNRLPEVLNTLLRQNKQLTTDVLVHTSAKRFFRFNFVAMYVPGVSVESVEAAMYEPLQNYLRSVSFGGWIQISDVLSILHSIPGVDNIRLAKSTDDGTNYGVKEYFGWEGGVQTSVSVGAVKTADFQIYDNEVAIANTIFVYRRSSNTFGS
jgi:uncharacterized phage protein gp47/JayE